MAGVDDDGETKKMVVVTNWRWGQGANAHDHSVARKDEAPAGEAGGTGEESDVCLRYGAVLG